MKLVCKNNEVSVRIMKEGIVRGYYPWGGGDETKVDVLSCMKILST